MSSLSAKQGTAVRSLIFIAPRAVLSFIIRGALPIAFVASLISFGWLLYSSSGSTADLPPLQNADFPDTYIETIHVDLTGPNHWVRLTWTGSQAERQDTGPFCSSPGRGWGTNDCNDPVESNCPDSRCTPKGTRKVEGFDDVMQKHPDCRYLTYISKRRGVSFHSFPSAISPEPSSQGCVRMEPHAARLIHDNSIVGKTQIVIDGTWTNPPQIGD